MRPRSARPGASGRRICRLRRSKRAKDRSLAGTRGGEPWTVSFSCDSRDVIRVCGTCQGFVRRCKRCRGFHLVYEGQGGEYSMPWWVSESWLKEHGCARRDLGDVPIPFVWMPDFNEPPIFDLATYGEIDGEPGRYEWSGSAEGGHRSPGLGGSGSALGAKPGSPIRPSGAMRVPAPPPSPAGCRETRYSLAVRPNLNVPKSTAHEYRSFSCRLPLIHVHVKFSLAL